MHIMSTLYSEQLERKEVGQLQKLSELRAWDPWA